jgi:hypothetical protein
VAYDEATALTAMQRILPRVQALQNRYAQRDKRAADVQAVRRGDFDKVAPDLFSDDWPRPIVANTVDQTARDIAAVLAPLPSFNCSSSSMLGDRARKFADKRTKIVNGYIQQSRLSAQMSRGADQYITYGILAFCVEPEFEGKTPRIVVEDSAGMYPLWDRYGRTVAVARVFYRDQLELIAEYPHLANKLKAPGVAVGSRLVKVIKYNDDDYCALWCPDAQDCLLEFGPNPLGKCWYVCIKRPGLDEEVRGQFDDLIWVQLALNRFQMLALEGADTAVRAPLVVTPDVGEIPVGPGAVIRAQGGVNSVGRARLDLPPQTWQGVQYLKSELTGGIAGADARNGQVDASVITGKGVQQLMAGFSTMISDAQVQFQVGLELVAQKCFEMEEKLWPNRERTIRGNDSGVPYEITYVASKDIKGDHTVECTYGMLAGLDANRALVYTLQAQAAGLLSKDFSRRQLPAGINAAEEGKKIEVEAMRDSLLQAMSALAQSTPQLIANGQDPSQILGVVAQVTDALQKNKPLEQIVMEAFPPPPPPEAAPEAQQQIDPLTGQPVEGDATGFNSSGLPGEMQLGQATEGPGGRPDLNQFFAGMTQGGQANLGMSVSRMSPAQ